MIRLHEGDPTETMVEWLRAIARIADPADAANLEQCAKRLDALYFGDAHTATDIDPTEIIPALGVQRQAFAMGTSRSLAQTLLAQGGAKVFSETAGDAAVRLMCAVADPADMSSDNVVVKRAHLSVMLAAYFVASEAHAAATMPKAPNGPVS